MPPIGWDPGCSVDPFMERRKRREEEGGTIAEVNWRQPRVRPRRQMATEASGSKDRFQLGTLISSLRAQTGFSRQPGLIKEGLGPTNLSAARV